MVLRSRLIKMPQDVDYSLTFQTSNASISYGDQQNENLVSQLIQKVAKLEAIIPKILNIGVDSLEACSLPIISIRMIAITLCKACRVGTVDSN